MKKKFLHVNKSIEKKTIKTKIAFYEVHKITFNLKIIYNLNYNQDKQ